MQQKAPKEAVRFGRALHRILDFFMEADPQLDPYLLRKVDLSYAYMRIWVRRNDISSSSLLIPKDLRDEDQVLGLRLFIPMGYM